MIRGVLSGSVFVALLFVAGCGPSGQQAANNDDWFRKRNEEFDRQRADFLTRDAQSVRDYQDYMNRQP